LNYYKNIIFSSIKGKLYQKKRKLFNFPKKIFQHRLWEQNLDNLYYGHYFIFRKYSKTILPYKINGEVQHGWSPISGIAGNPNDHSHSFKKRRFYVFNKQNQIKCNELGYPNVVPIGAPFIYIENLMEGLENFDKNSLILFPSHSHEWAKFSKPIQTFQNYIMCIERIKSKFSNICVSLSWNEYQNKDLRKLFKNQSIKTITMGPRDGNPNFLQNFVNAVKKFEYVSSDTFSSPIFYSLMICRKVFIYGDLLSSQKKYSDEYENIDNSAYVKYAKLYPELLWENFEHKAYPSMAKKELGLSHKKSSKEIRKLFEWKIII